MPRRVDPIRQYSSVSGRKREQLQGEYADLGRQLAAVDEELSRLSRQRLAIQRERRALRSRLWLNLGKRGRQPGPDGSEVLPPAAPDATMLWGRRLRARCRDILRRHDTLPLAALHAELHRSGYAIDHRYPVKALGDALGYEADQGRVHRVARGVYRLCA